MNLYESCEYILNNLTYPFKSKGVGLEKGLNAKDTVFCRVDPMQSIDNGGLLENSCYIYIGVNKMNKEYYEAIGMLSAIVDTILQDLPNDVSFNSFEMDNDTLPSLRMGRVLVTHKTDCMV